MFFADHFSKHATEYAKYRPGYPAELFAWLSSQTSGHELVWDVGTGNGQAAIEAAQFYTRVIATDPSQSQIQNATPHKRVTYQVSPAEHCDLADRSVDLVMIAQALHWFDFDEFYAQARRVLKPAGLVAAWTYTLNKVDPNVDAVVHEYYTNIVGSYWPAERCYIDQNYQTIPFPFTEIAAPPIHMETRWTLDDYVGYLRTWSATQRYQQTLRSDPIELIAQSLRDAWGDADAVRLVIWPIHVRAGRVSQ